MARSAKLVPLAAALQMFLMTSGARDGARRRRLGGAALCLRMTGVSLPGDATPTPPHKERPTMPRFAANLTMMFTRWPFLDRLHYRRGLEAGFDAMEVPVSPMTAPQRGLATASAGAD